MEFVQPSSQWESATVGCRRLWTVVLNGCLRTSSSSSSFVAASAWLTSSSRLLHEAFLVAEIWWVAGKGTPTMLSLRLTLIDGIFLRPSSPVGPIYFSLSVVWPPWSKTLCQCIASGLQRDIKRVAPPRLGIGLGRLGLGLIQRLKVRLRRHSKQVLAAPSEWRIRVMLWAAFSSVSVRSKLRLSWKLVIVTFEFRIA